jgi:hypothetical protein
MIRRLEVGYRARRNSVDDKDSLGKRVVPEL